MQQLDLLSWTPPRQVIPFPSSKQVGHARRVAEALAKARTSREADRVLTRSHQSFCRQLNAAGFPEDEITRQHESFLCVVNAECEKIQANWMPVMPGEGRRPGGAA
jgi:hypothetical protein